MSIINYEGPKPIAGLWLLDNGEKVFTFVNVVTLVMALISGYAKLADSPRRAPSLQWMGADGYCDATVLLDQPTCPDNLPDDTATNPAARKALDEHIIGKSTHWYELTTQADQIRKDHRVELARKVRAFHALHLQPVPATAPTQP